MPTYQYQCECGNAFEVNKRMRDCDIPEHCPKCKKHAKRIIVPGNGYILKGDGWPGKEIKNEKYNKSNKEKEN